MNSWGNDFGMANMMGGMMPNMIPGMPTPMGPYPMMGEMPPHMNHMGQPMMNPMMAPNNAVAPPPPEQLTFIGPVVPETQDNSENAVDPDDGQGNEEMQIVIPEKPPQSSRDRSDRRDRDRTERNRRRSRSRNRDRSSRSDRHDRSRNDRDYRDRQSKWDNTDKFTQAQKPPGLVQTPPNMMQYNNMMSNQMPPMMPQQMDLANMQQIMQAGMNMIPNMMMINPQMQMANQPIYFSTGVILPPLPGTTTPPRREKPAGCRTIFVGGLAHGVTENVLMEIFQRFGDITEVKLHKGVCHVRFEKLESVELSLALSGYRLKGHDQNENEATTLFIDYALNRDDQNEFEKKRKRDQTPPRMEYTPATLNTITDKIKSDTDFAEAASSLAAWLERGECNKKNANIFYSLIQATNNQLRRLFTEKMQLDEEYQTLRNTIKDKFAHILLQFEQVAKILTAAKHQRVSDHFSKQQRRNIEMWLKMTEELENIKEEFSSTFDDDEVEKGGRNVVPLEKYEQLRVENENLTYELEGYKNEAHLAKDEAERKFEKFKAHFVAQQALQNKQQVYPPLPPPPMPSISEFNTSSSKPLPPPPLPDDKKAAQLPSSDAKLISMLSAFLMVHPLGASLDYLVSYAKTMIPNVTQSAVHDVLNKYSDVFRRKTTGVGACIEHKWCFVVFNSVQPE